MSTSFLYHVFGVRGYLYRRTEYRGGEAFVHIEQKPGTCRCAACGSRNVVGAGKVVRQFRALPVGRRPVWIVFPVPRVECRSCGRTRQVTIGFAEPRRSYTKAFARYVLDLSRCMTLKDVAMHLRISWDVVKDIQKENLRRRFGKPKLHRLRRIAIDEISVAKGHRYLTVVLDLDRGQVVYVGEGKGADALLDFWKQLGRRPRIEAVAMDMSPAYIAAVTEHLPRATLVFDRFHVMNLFNDKLSNLRRALYHQLADSLQKQVLKGVRWLLLKRPENLDETRNERQRLEEALKLNAPLAIAYYLKEDLAELWEQEDQEAAQAHLMDWILRAEASGIQVLKSFAKTLRLYAWQILAYYDYPITTGPLEGTNNKIKTMKRQAYGFRDAEFFKLKILGIHETTYALVG